LFPARRRGFALARKWPGKRQNQQAHDEQAKSQKKPIAQLATPRGLLILLLEKPDRAKLQPLFPALEQKVDQDGDGQGRHAGDARAFVYSPEEWEAGATHDPLWNAAQRELVATGTIHNYLRMLWGKKILEWTRSPEDALDVMIELNNRYALDGRDPNSYSGIFWVLGRYDRPWGPERPIFGTIRYMSSANTARKWNVEAYLRRFASGRSLV
jgi:deoxyribodipyrimidine photolyase